MFHQHIDIEFDKLFEKYGLTDELINAKSKILKVYDSESYMMSKYILDKIKVRHFQIDREGVVISK